MVPMDCVEEEGKRAFEEGRGSHDTMVVAAKSREKLKTERASNLNTLLQNVSFLRVIYW